MDLMLWDNNAIMVEDDFLIVMLDDGDNTDAYRILLSNILGVKVRSSHGMLDLMLEIILGTRGQNLKFFTYGCDPSRVNKCSKDIMDAVRTYKHKH